MKKFSSPVLLSTLVSSILLVSFTGDNHAEAEKELKVITVNIRRGEESVAITADNPIVVRTFAKQHPWPYWFDEETRSRTYEARHTIYAGWNVQIHYPPTWKFAVPPSLQSSKDDEYVFSFTLQKEGGGFEVFTLKLIDPTPPDATMGVGAVREGIIPMDGIVKWIPQSTNRVWLLKLRNK